VKRRPVVGVRVVGICADGWFCSTFTLAGYARARQQLERCEVIGVEVFGALA